MKIRDVWSSNFDAELLLFDRCLYRYNLLSVDTEFPGFLRNTPRDALEDERYRDLKFNVENLKMIQLGVTLSDASGNMGFSWEFNLSDFDLKTDPHVEASVNLLKRNGFDFEKIGRDGIQGDVFRSKFLWVLSRHGNLKWITFHGLYDLAYILKLLGNKNEMPRTVFDFAKEVSMNIGSVFDIKFVGRYCKGLMGGEIGLNRMASILGVERCGDAHNAGSDSLLTACVHAEIKKAFAIDERIYLGYLYGLQVRIQPKKVVLVPVYQPLHFPHPAHPVVVYCRRHLNPPGYFVPHAVQSSMFHVYGR